MIRVAITEDHPEMREALRMLLSLSGDIQLVSETDNGQEAVDCAKRIQPDVLIMAINMPGVDGFEATKQIADLSSVRHINGRRNGENRGTKRLSMLKMD